MRQHRKYIGRGVRSVTEQLAALTAAAGVMMILLCGAAFMMTKFDAEKSVLSSVSTAALVTGAYFGGYTGGRRRRRNGLASGAVTGLLIFLMTVIVGNIFIKSAEGLPSFGKLLMIVGAAAAGGAVGVNCKRDM